MRILICGGPSTGKTTLSRQYKDHTVRHSDSLNATHEWSEQSNEVSKWLDAPGDHVIEGVTVIRALRKWLDRNPQGKPADKIIVLTKPHKALTRGQQVMTNVHTSLWKQLEPVLRRRGVEIERR